ncbi:hypothetical protein C8J56DRAFT_196923 [Mycena floridula]|nr:hypothetical protein C8J56DRAFT_196923 [Mycena floridula]
MRGLRPWFSLELCRRGVFSSKPSRDISVRFLSTKPPVEGFRLKVIPIPANTFPKDRVLARKLIKESFQSFGDIKDIILPTGLLSKKRPLFVIDFQPTDDLKARWESLTQERILTTANGREFEVDRPSKPAPAALVVSMEMLETALKTALSQFGELKSFHWDEKQGAFVVFENPHDLAKAIKDPMSLVVTPDVIHPVKPTKNIRILLKGPLRDSAKQDTSIVKTLLETLKIPQRFSPIAVKVNVPRDPDHAAFIYMKFNKVAAAQKVMEAVAHSQSAQFTCKVYYSPS